MTEEHDYRKTLEHVQNQEFSEALQYLDENEGLHRSNTDTANRGDA